MRIPNIARVGGLAGLASIAAAQTIQGFNYGATKNDGSCMVYSDFAGLFNAAKNLPGTSGFASARLYTSIQCGSQNAPIEAFKAATDTGTSVLVGMWASAGAAVIDNEITALLAAVSSNAAPLSSQVKAMRSSG